MVEQPELEVLYVLDSHLHMTDAFARCARCDAHYLLEMVDISGTTAVFRISAVGADAVAKTIRSLTRGSCDINRARNEVFSLSASTQALDTLLVMRAGVFTEAVTKPETMTLPTRSWRELPCDGSLIAALGLSD